MTGAILTLNAGSSSLKFSVFRQTGDSPLATGLVDRIGSGGILRLRGPDGADLPAKGHLDFANHAAALDSALACLRNALPSLSIEAVGHRVVHGGPDLSEPVVIDEAAMTYLAGLEPFAPLHQPHNLAGIRASLAAFPAALQVACFDTAFHRGHPFVHDVFALPRSFYDKGIRRYGFHGLSYSYVVGELARLYPHLSAGRIVIAHLGNGASMCAVDGGRSIATTMGFSPLDGLPMGTRCGQIDPGVILHLLEREKMTPAEIGDLLYRRSGFLGLSGVSNDMRTLEASDLPAARETIDVFVSRIQRELGSLAAALGGLDAFVFCGGIGENSTTVRGRVCERLGWLGIHLDAQRNAANATKITADTATTPVLVIPTNEEIVLARAVRARLTG
ncbi:MAG: acetate/propionate family kinase [Labrys sp. (in: a-proteobacteria)]